MSESQTPQERSVRVWDPWVRISHWLVAAGFLAAYLSAEEVMALHVWAGYLVATLVLLRVAWGFVGARHARFADFVPSPARLAAYVRDIGRGRERRYLGHNPLGGVMALALLLALASTATTGMMTLGAEEQAGPLRGLYAAQGAGAGLTPIAAARADEDEEAEAYHEAGEEEEGEEAGEALEEVHELSANLTLGLVVLHVLGVAWTSWRERQNLARAMVDGRKRPVAEGDGS
ncbi:cytochrome b/b6 domain-containing protein [Halorhodospira neutriphila]|uniref:Cytochrome b561 bacterial/Ni-hydrogenase domain-containing protein n=1 Tax=Halorhodospira neutriphila TaxID=168379 RepID=A0ABS1E586_9GAMM|nr:cytochrome b/b6 domain-containing protein [Halorhodospira neutriphila]MBK1726347.1 hypothetical protein [Halorhodospira neutriphila]